MEQYKELCRKVLIEGEMRGNRTATKAITTFGHQMRFNLQEGFPLLTTKELHLRSVIYELLWFIKGNTNIKFLKDHGVRIWNEWADEDGELGPVYGKQWRNWESGIIYDSGWPYIEKTDQLADVIESIMKDPYSRRHIVSAWNVGDLKRMALPPCHLLFQFYVSDKGLSLQLYQRSADVFLGVPFNIASYALLLEIVAQITGHKAHEFIHTIGDAHIYEDHIPQVVIQNIRKPRALPKLHIKKKFHIDEFEFEDFSFEGYDPHPPLKGKVST